MVAVQRNVSQKSAVQRKRRSRVDPRKVAILVISIIVVIFVSTKVFAYTTDVVASIMENGSINSVLGTKLGVDIIAKKPELDRVDYDLRLFHLAHAVDLNNATSTAEFKSRLKFGTGTTFTTTLTPIATSTATASNTVVANTNISTSKSATTTKQSPTVSVAKAPVNAVVKALWPVQGTAYPKVGAILPFKRIVAYYGNLYSKKMGVLGEYEPDDVLRRLKTQVKEWELADPTTPVQPALHYIAVVAQGSAGKDGKYRARMPDAEIDKVLEMAKKIDAIVFLDIQVALSDVQHELPALEKYLSMPNVHLGIDPEFSMKSGNKPGTVIGTMDARDINYTATYLAGLVQKHDLPPKVLTFYRFTRNMVTNFKNIQTIPEVQMVLTMDGWGHQARKIGTYKGFVYPEPIQFTGFKLFYKNDLKQENARLMTASEVIKLTPAPIYIQYQ